MSKRGFEWTEDERAGLIGRTAELAQLLDLAEQTARGHAHLVLLSGEAGIGKSSLVAELVHQLNGSGWDGHVGYCIEYGARPLPFGPIVGVLRSLLLRDLDDVDESVGRHRADLSTLIPELGADDDVSTSLVGDVDRLLDAIVATLIAVSRRRPLVVVIEDVHWSDASTRDLLALLIRSAGNAGILLVLTERSGTVEQGHPLRTWLAEQRRLPNVTSITLEGLSHVELERQATTILGYAPDDAVVTDLLERTGGNPYFAHELLVARRDGIETLPSSLTEFLTSRIGELTDDERLVLRAVAVAGGTVSHERLAAILPELSIGPIVRDLFDASVLVLNGTAYAFWHALVRSAILADLLPFEAEDLHRRAALALTDDLRRSRSPSDLASLAEHWEQANDWEQSLPVAVEAADASAAVAAYDTAAEMGLQALRAWSRIAEPEQLTDRHRDELVLQTSEWLSNCYRGAEAVALVEASFASWGANLPAGRKALLLAHTAPIQFHLGNPIEVAGLLAEAERLIGDEISPEAAQVHHRISKQAVADGQIQPALQAAERAIEIASHHGPDIVLVEALTTRALAVGVTDDLEHGVVLAREARHLALDKGLVSQVANTYRTEMLVYIFREGRTEACLDASRQGLAYAEAHCGPRWRTVFLKDLGVGYVEAGYLDDAAPLLEQLLASQLDDMGRLMVLHAAAAHSLATGELDIAGTHLAEAGPVAGRYQSAQETGVQARLMAELARRQGQLQDADELIDKALKLQMAEDNLSYTRESIVEKIRIVKAFAQSGRADTSEMLSDVTELVQTFDGEGAANVAMRSLMELELASIMGPIASDAAGSTIGLLEGSGFRYEAAQVRLLLVDQLITEGADSDELKRQIVDLADIARSHGMTWISERIAAMARKARVSVGRDRSARSSTENIAPGGGAPAGLTHRELEVLSLLAQGLTNKAIGERLYVSPRTVGTHVSNLLAKLGASNRGEAAAAYHQLEIEAVEAREQEAETKP